MTRYEYVHRWTVLREIAGSGEREVVECGMSRADADALAEHRNAGPDGPVVGSGYASYLVRHEDDLDWCYLCASVGEQTLATRRGHADIGTLTDSHGEHDLCDFCADQIDEAGPCETCEPERAQEAEEGVDGE